MKPCNFCGSDGAKFGPVKPTEKRIFTYLDPGVPPDKGGSNVWRAQATEERTEAIEHMVRGLYAAGDGWASLSEKDRDFSGYV